MATSRKRASLTRSKLPNHHGAVAFWERKNTTTHTSVLISIRVNGKDDDDEDDDDGLT